MRPSFSAVLLLLALMLSGCASVETAHKAGAGVGYSSIYDAASAATYLSDGTYYTSNSDLSFPYELTVGDTYSFSQAGDTLVYIPLERALTEGEQWMHGNRSYELLSKTEDLHLIASRWLGDSACIDGWQSGQSRILFSSDRGLISIVTEQLSCDDNSLRGYSSTNFVGKIWNFE